MSDLEFVKMEALGLAVDESTLTYCPCCDNASPWPPSLSVTRKDSGIVYNCYRSSCSFKGLVGSASASFATAPTPKPVWTPNPYTGETKPLSPVMIDRLWEKYEINYKQLSRNLVKMIQSPYTDRSGLLFPLFTVTGSRFGATTKYFGVAAKARHHLEYQETLLHFPLRNPSEDGLTVRAVLVEDVLSAVKCTEGLTQGIALLGTTLNEEKVKLLLRNGYKDVVLALDPDALCVATKLAKKWSLFFRTFRVVSLSADPKDLSRKQLWTEIDG